jgi:hypothetical protein
MKKCPPGVICIENFTILFIFIIIFFICYLAFKNMNTKSSSTNIDIVQNPSNPGFFSWVQRPSYPYNNLDKDVLLNPYTPPYKDERYFVPELNYVPPGAVPVNLSTNINAVDTTYRQLGIITPLNGVSKDNILPLMGRPLFTRRSLWQYYTISNQHNNVKLPVSVRGKSGLNEYGVDEIYSGDTVYIEGYNDAFKVTMYDTDTIKYLPSF